MNYKKEFLISWNENGGLIMPKIAAEILGVNQSTISRRKDLKRIIINNDTFLSLTEVLNKSDIKPRAKRKKNE